MTVMIAGADNRRATVDGRTRVRQGAAVDGIELSRIIVDP
jgi:hypothetical protein